MAVIYPSYILSTPYFGLRYTSTLFILVYPHHYSLLPLISVIKVDNRSLKILSVIIERITIFTRLIKK